MTESARLRRLLSVGTSLDVVLSRNEAEALLFEIDELRERVRNLETARATTRHNLVAALRADQLGTGVHDGADSCPLCPPPIAEPSG